MKATERRIRVMLVDDQVLLREGLRTIIELNEDMTVIKEAGNGKEAIDFLEKGACDVILMDIRMPGMNGIEATQKIKRIDPDVAILILTTFNEEELIVDALISGADGYILKDIDAKHLIGAVTDAYNGNFLMPGKVAAKLARRLAVSSDKGGEKTDGSGFGLSKREMDVARLISEGYTNQQIANALFLSEGTVKNYISEIYSKLGTSNRTKAGAMIRKSQ